MIKKESKKEINVKRDDFIEWIKDNFEDESYGRMAAVLISRGFDYLLEASPKKSLTAWDDSKLDKLNRAYIRAKEKADDLISCGCINV